ncbi:MAG: beta-lactamase domain protein [Myxococcales bacterium]|nr:beta-lactamase domain protein [Myxococcales bacterium]
MKLLSSLALAGLAVASLASSARAESKLSVQVVTASPQGFLVNSALVSGEKDVVVIDGQLTLADGHRLVAAILDSKKTLTTVYVTHWHPDHYFGLVALKQAFPKAKIVAQPATVADIKKTWAAKVKQWSPMFGDNLTAKPVIPTALTGNTITLEGQTLEIHGPVQGDAESGSYVWIPSIKALITGDNTYQGTFVWTAETNAESRKGWLKTLDEMQALKPEIVVAGHKDPKLKDDASAIEATRAYLKDFDVVAASSKSAEELETKMKAKYPKLAMDIVLHIGAGAQFPAAASAAPTPKK